MVERKIVMFGTIVTTCCKVSFTTKIELALLDEQIWLLVAMASHNPPTQFGLVHGIHINKCFTACYST